MHGLQILPLIGSLLGRLRRWTEPAQVLGVVAAGVLYLGIMAFLAWLAWQSRPLIAN
jgi:hypothetical protein